MRFHLSLAALLLSGSAAFALTSQEVVDQMTAAGFTRVEVQTGPTQIKVEAFRGTEKVETVFDAATGVVLKREIELADAGDDISPGVEIRTRDKDFLDSEDRSDDDSTDDDSTDDDSTDDDSTDDNGGDDSSDDDSGTDDNGTDDNGGDDSSDDDSGGDDDDDDHGGDDNSGHGNDHDDNSDQGSDDD